MASQERLVAMVACTMHGKFALYLGDKNKHGKIILEAITSMGLQFDMHILVFLGGIMI
jgi:hypothetical protein